MPDARHETRIAAWLRPRGARPFVLGHRGARHAAPENTLAAFELARAEGADGVELDVRLDGAGRVIVLHDRTLGRVSGGSEMRDIETLGAADIARVSLGGERVPELAAVLAWAREHERRVNIELKHDVSSKAALVTAVRRVVRASRLGPELLLFSSFDAGLVAALALLVPELPRAWLIDRGHPLLSRAPAFRLIADGVNPHRALVTARALARWKRHAAPVATWTVNEDSEAIRLAALGVDTLISDRPAAILAALPASPNP